MRIRTFYDQYMYRLLNTIFLCGVLMLFGNEWLEIGVPVWLLLGAAIFFTTLVLLLEIVGRKLVISVGGIVFVIAIVLLLEQLSVPVVSVFQEAFNWLFSSRDGEEVYALRHALLSVLPLLFISTIVVFQIIRFRKVRYGFGVVLLLGTIVLAVTEQMVSRWYVFLISMILLSILFEFVIKDRVALTHLLPLVFVVALVLTILPARQESIHWLYFAETSVDFLRRTGRRISDIFPGREGGEFGVAMTGFTEVAGIRGEIVASEREALRVRTGNNAQDIYLIGSVMDTYTGSGWIRSQNMDTLEYPEHILDLFELLVTLHNKGVLSEYREYVADIIEMRNMDITFLNIRTRSVFYPLKTYSIAYSGRMDASGASMLFRRRAEEGTSYTIRYLAVNYRSEEIERILQGDIGEDKRGLQDFSANLNRALGLRLLGARIFPEDVEILRQRRERIYHYYTLLPDSIPERVHALAREITAPYTTTFEKMRAIEEYFTRQGFLYTLTPPPLPDGDFVDWFLFEGESGYCTYFATAAAVLGRLVGIPVRYVQGFRVFSEGRTVIVRNYNAHAWVEAYITGFGWVPFEPTPTFYGRQNQGFAVGEEIHQPIIPEHQPPSQIEEAEIIDVTEMEAEEARRTSLYAYVLSVAFGIVVIVLLLLLAGGYYLLHKSKKRYQDANTIGRFRYDFGAILFLLELQGKQILLGETLRGFAKRMKHEELEKVVMIHEKLIYQKGQLDSQDMAEMMACKEGLYKNLQGRASRVKYMLYLLSN